jgi:hypothetical protein
MSTVSATNLKHASSASNNIVLDASGNTAISGSATVGGVAVVTTTGTQTLTNKTLTSPVITGASVSSMASSVITSGTSQASTSGTSIDFTGIPSWVKRITIMFNGVSTGGTSIKQIQLGDSGGVETTGYLGTSVALIDAIAVNAAIIATGFGIRSGLAADTLNGAVVITNLTNNTWVAQGALTDSSRGAGYLVGGAKALSATLDRVRITTVNGTDAFDAGSINILYE